MEQEIKRLAEFFAEMRPDIAEALHDILEGRKWNHHRIREDKRYVHYHVKVHHNDVFDYIREEIESYDDGLSETDEVVSSIERILNKHEDDIPSEIVITYDVADDELYVKDEKTGRELDQINTPTKSNFFTP